MTDPADAAAELRRAGATTVRASRAGIGWALAGSIAFAAAGAALLVGAVVAGSAAGIPAALVGAAAVLFFGVVGVPVLVHRAATADRAVRLDRHGVVLGDGSRAAWSAVRSARLETLLGQRFVVLRLDGPHAAAGLRPPQRLLARWNEGLLRRRHDARPGRWALALPTQLERSPAELLQLVQAARRLARG